MGSVSASQGTVAVLPLAFVSSSLFPPEADGVGVGVAGLEADRAWLILAVFDCGLRQDWAQ